MYGDLANKLVLEAKRTQQLSQAGFNKQQLPAYQDELIRGIIREVSALKKNVDYLREEQLADQNNKMTQCRYVVAMLSMERNKRCLLAYEKLRSELLDAMVWDNNGMEFSSLLSTSNSKTQFDSSMLSHAEQEYLKEYSQLLTELKSGQLSEIDLTGTLEPPSDVFIDVRVLKDAGQIETEYGVFNLIKDSQFFVRQSDVERLIQQGYLQKI
ncbi:DNA replication complex GINS protein PSF1 [Kluyveromyces marxianus]|uniref:DNA replication complex GINS protein PSF1 n=2 Tax=Kluyveromyces marxianus TaxID=4911 RepID=W0TB96_KLUMD|nr:DNA replication complex GINS protein PSF1 [Kluyveromyces marxianus DMKU3-1042]KAG0672422.1 DNA replication protein psf1 [Kluyveromyces marxianus]KAG0683963.1 DNA replication protein psf1 [Kluyveromyces marxianus]QGN16615.1 DNA replication complex GINS protein PSF1 [Kluyveromyces marxianus]BAO40897.1 DNA replication complex GINS protein PSF1 [Kluyveromyces marxianus DMKU3-1042]BAP72358.1 DNA replication complex GINS protein PSF1 [Kluyveromyces marxianus]